MPRDRGRAVRNDIPKYRMIAAFADKTATVPLDMADKIGALHISMPAGLCLSILDELNDFSSVESATRHDSFRG